MLKHVVANNEIEAIILVWNMFRCANLRFIEEGITKAILGRINSLDVR